MYLKSTYLFRCSRARYEFLSSKILGYDDAERHNDFFWTWLHLLLFKCIVLSFEYRTVKFSIVSFVAIIMIVIVARFALVCWIIIIITLFQCN